MRESHTAVIEKNCAWHGPFASEPHEVAWAREAIFFIRALEETWPPEASVSVPMVYQVEISPDGRYWCPLAGHRQDFDPARQVVLHAIPVTHFGGWLRLTGHAGAPVRIMLYLALKA